MTLLVLDGNVYYLVHVSLLIAWNEKADSDMARITPTKDYDQVLMNVELVLIRNE